MTINNSTGAADKPTGQQISRQVCTFRTQLATLITIVNIFSHIRDVPSPSVNTQTQTLTTVKYSQFRNDFMT